MSEKHATRVETEGLSANSPYDVLERAHIARGVTQDAINANALDLLKEGKSWSGASQHDKTYLDMTSKSLTASDEALKKMGLGRVRIHNDE